MAEYFKNSVNFNFEVCEKGYNDVKMSLKRINLECDEDIMAESKLENETNLGLEPNDSLVEFNLSKKYNHSFVGH